jgi:hypothetical protein
MGVLYRTVSRQADGWHVESVGDEDEVETQIFPSMGQALAWCCAQCAIPPPDYAEGGQVLAALDGEDDDLA